MDSHDDDGRPIISPVSNIGDIRSLEERSDEARLFWIPMRSASMRSWSNSFEASGRLAVPVRFMWLHTSSSGFNSGA
jgi:hypothetical protein